MIGIGRGWLRAEKESIVSGLVSLKEDFLMNCMKEYQIIACIFRITHSTV